MPLSLLSLNAAIVCDDKELETYDVKQEGTSSLRAFIASEAGKQFNVTFSNNLTDVEVAIYLYVDGRLVRAAVGEFLGPYKGARSILHFKFQELQLVDPDVEDAPIAPEVGTIELRAYRCQRRCVTGPSSKSTHEALHRGHVSERSKKAGWHHVATGDEIPISGRAHRVKVDYLDHPRKGPPYASIKVFYRPRELLRAQGIITGDDGGGQGPPINNTKRAREDGSPGPSRSRTKMKREEISVDTRGQRIRGLQAELDALNAAKQSRTSVKRELRSPSPIVVRHAGEVVDLTLDD
ncbi:hypothetical protein EDB92DRAFT_1824871 [Lactarius akahatsu]|uniref:DUF7918 domain-containing protein n=1 Tax=Lactarius akahatsu TaxID=416441 RepID=A0AAD4QFI5_9AGAM|nr:hypothetical protein EDB92DRAFT_1824871 [Lactarius akahatsu]